MTTQPDTRDEDAAYAETMALVGAISPLLAGKDPSIQGATIAYLLAMWLAGNPNFIRADLLKSYMELAVSLIKPCERELFGGGEHPANRAL